MKTIAALSMTLALAGISFAQTAAPVTPAAKPDTATATTAKKSKKHVSKKAVKAPVATAAPAVSK
jgi:hypothetical protein